MNDPSPSADSLPKSNGRNGNGNGGSLLRLMRRIIPGIGKPDTSLREALEDIIDNRNELSGSIAEHERVLISNILDLRDLRVVDIMVPRADIVALEANTKLDEILSLLANRPHSRLPVFRETLDNVIGVIHIKDMLAAVGGNQAFELKDHIRDVPIVSPAMRALDLMLQMRQTRVHIALVIDEFGGIDGLVTINDIIEAIVGEIDDEHDYDIQPQFVERSDGTALADARYDLEEFEQRFGRLDGHEEADHETLGGFVCTIAGRVPARGEVIKHDSGLEFEVVEGDLRRITKLRIRNLPKKKRPPTEAHT